jgi:L-2-hydroxyglutarate oxidase
MKYDFTIIGAGIIGLSVGLAITEQYVDAKVLILDKENDIATHQTGRNSGVIHSGIYYKPGSLKARLAKKGNKQLVDFCQEHHIPYDVCGKLIVATEESELAQLNRLYELGIENGLQVERVEQASIQEMEPYLKAIKGIHVPSTGIVDYKKVAETFARLIEERNGRIMLGEEVKEIKNKPSAAEIVTSNQKIVTDYVINCTGLMSDRVVKMAGIQTDMKIVPFRGEYYELKPDKRYLVNNLIYPVPNPDFPFLGVHFTRMMDGRVLVGPNAVLSFKREGYHKSSFNWKDAFDTCGFSGFWKLASQNLGEGLKEMYRSFNKYALVKELQRFIPEMKPEDLVPATAGVRAQALDSSGALIDDFFMIRDRNILHVCNAPSPAATASIEIGRKIVKDMARGF